MCCSATGPASRVCSRRVLPSLDGIRLVTWIATKAARAEQVAVPVERRLVRAEQARRLGDALQLEQLERHGPVAVAVTVGLLKGRNSVDGLAEELLHLLARAADELRRGELLLAAVSHGTGPGARAPAPRRFPRRS